MVEAGSGGIYVFITDSAILQPSATELENIHPPRPVRSWSAKRDDDPLHGQWIDFSYLYRVNEMDWPERPPFSPHSHARAITIWIPNTALVAHLSGISPP